MSETELEQNSVVKEEPEIKANPKASFFELVENMPETRQLQILKVIENAGLNENDSLFVFLYTMGYIKTMYEDIPEALTGLTEKLDSITTENTEKIKDALSKVLDKSKGDITENLKTIAETQKRYVDSSNKHLGEVEEKIYSMLEDLNVEISQKFVKMLDEQEKINNITEKKGEEFEKKIENSVGKIVEDAGRGLQNTLEEQRKLNEEIKESAKIYQIGVSLSNKQLSMAVDKQKVKIVEIFVDTMKKDLPEIIEDAIIVATDRINKRNQSSFLKKFMFYTGVITTSLVLSHIINHFIK